MDAKGGENVKFIADGLTVLRVLSAAGVALCIWQGAWELATIVFLVGILSDAFDGIAARRWPYSPSENMRYPWRKDPHAFDNAADLSLSTAALLGVTLALLPFWGAVAVVIAVAGVSLIFVKSVELAAKTDVKRAERIDVAHGFVYGAELFVMLVVMTWQAFEFWPWIVAGYVVLACPLLWAKRDRITSRPEVDYGGH
ncbi:hypothetical protein RAAC3_TM7C00001G0670 [Candidatus Saccharibacteria bacterium RAAC3_TM7_1]|nr:hypothetical protein RAAC3_TM7C00001G0670 [Candidatus Saccharibacteria bacterium RAAC3_TM7_1]HCZ28614.1 hypothetical protein [Candidatus Saccharibacteria bacterium]